MMNGVAPNVRAVYMHGNNSGATVVHGSVSGTATPGTRTPGTRTPGTRTPGTRTPGTRTPGTITPGRCTPITLVNKKYHDIMAASNASTVAIDNKIEQAMDLVKSHLMFAVREEVEVLKEKIGELMDRISQLEYENTVLRQCATQDALQQIAQPHPNSNT